MTIKDSGNRRKFESGAVRDMAEGKGRCDLLPLHEFNTIHRNDNNGYPNYFLGWLQQFEEDGMESSLIFAFEQMLKELDWNLWQAMLEVSIHFEEGAKKYGDNNWQKGIPANVYIDSAIRHYCKFKIGMTDERHDRAVLWNLICCMWTCENIPELNVYAEAKPNEQHD